MDQAEEIYWDLIPESARGNTGIPGSALTAHRKRWLEVGSRESFVYQSYFFFFCHQSREKCESNYIDPNAPALPLPSPNQVNASSSERGLEDRGHICWFFRWKYGRSTMRERTDDLRAQECQKDA